MHCLLGKIPRVISWGLLIYTSLTYPRKAILDTLSEGRPRQGYFLGRHRRSSNIHKVVYGLVRPSKASSGLGTFAV
ncbi:hypothetical protein CY34DRAFT_812007, partial [Suillus luteus UH-Slu-Lm8-n1]